MPGICRHTTKVNPFSLPDMPALTLWSVLKARYEHSCPVANRCLSSVLFLCPPPDPQQSSSPLEARFTVVLLAPLVMSNGYWNNI